MLRKSNFVLAVSTLLLFSGLTMAQKLRKVAEPVKNSYVVILDDPSPARLDSRGREIVINRLAAKYGVRIKAIYSAVLNGFSIAADESRAIELSKDRLVESVWEDALAYPN